MNSSRGGFVRLSTDQFAERDRAEVMREVFGRAIMKLEFEPLPDIPLTMDKVLRSLPDFGLSIGTNSPMHCVRTAQLIDSDDLILTVALSGGGVISVHDKEAQISGGSAVLTRSADPHRFDIQATTKVMTFRLGFNRIAPLIADLGDALIRPIAANTEALRLLIQYAGVLQDEDTLATPEVRNLAATHLHDLAALAIGATHNAALAGLSRGVRAARLRAIKSDVVKNLTDRQLSIDAAAARHGVSSCYVRMLFQGDATTFSEFVIVQRLSRAHRLLADPRLLDRTISSIAFDAGFGDLSYFNRVFRRRYGETPSDVRARMRREEPSG